MLAPTPIQAKASSSSSKLYLSQARASDSTEDCMALYEKWAASYNDEVGDSSQDYVAPVLVAQAAIKHGLSNGATNSVILDAVADMNRPIDKKDGTYDLVSCVGTFTLGHVGPDPALRELVRVAKNKGVVVSTILQEIWVSGGFQAEVEKLVAEGLVKVVTEELIDYVKGHGDKAVLLILEKIDRH
ncbi:hypothetical protein PITC_053190 [Penicillium italicum]|uniref:Methyltransferase type 11 n=1 Tax=Penicillium italicum TaxID=40296 RepID=A0A0A2KMB8_PENIT|nr:hypothetical protein PITC_053190 [Penicillium italicum]